MVNQSAAGVTPDTGGGWAEIHDLHNSNDWGSGHSMWRGSSTSTAVDWDDLRAGGGGLFTVAAVAVEVAEAAAAGGGTSRPLIQVVPKQAKIRAASW
jgi:hypothetical protein